MQNIRLAEVDSRNLFQNLAGGLAAAAGKPNHLNLHGYSNRTAKTTLLNRTFIMEYNFKNWLLKIKDTE